MIKIICMHSFWRNKQHSQLIQPQKHNKIQDQARVLYILFEWPWGWFGVTWHLLVVASGGRRWPAVVGGSGWPSLTEKWPYAQHAWTEHGWFGPLWRLLWGVLVATHGGGGVGESSWWRWVAKNSWWSNQKICVVGPHKRTTWLGGKIGTRFWGLWWLI